MKAINLPSIRTKLIFVTMLTSCVALLLALLALGVHDYLRARSQLEENTLARAEIIANACEAALMFNDPQPADEMLRSLSADPRLGAASVCELNGNILASFQRPGWNHGIGESSSVEPSRFHREYLEVNKAVVVDGRTIGYVQLQTDLKSLQTRLRGGLTTSLFVLLAAAGLAYLIANRLQVLISGPILELAETSRLVAGEKNYSVRATKRGNDELGQLVDGFNEMLSQIEARDNTLQEVQLELERRVVIRTTELFAANTELQSEVAAHKRAREESDALRQKLQVAYENLQREAERRSGVQEALRLSEQRFSRAFRSSPVPLAIVTRDTRMMVDVNDRFVELVGGEARSVIGSPLFDLPTWQEPETRARVDLFFKKGEPLRNWQCRITGASGQLRSALLSAESFMIGSEPCVMLMTEDISERVNLETQLRQVQKMEAIGQLASGVAHDFNNLLTIIQGYTQLVLAMQPAGGMIHDALEKITNATQRATQLTGQLLTFSRKQIPKPRPIDINEVADNVTGMLNPLLGENIRLKYTPATELPLVEGDAGMLEQVIVNLAVNARDAMSKGGDLVITTSLHEIDSHYQHVRPQAESGSYVCLQVSDTGCGMNTATLERIFEPFFTTKGIGKGTGLGLATAYGIVKQHEGWIEVVSHQGLGTTFKVFLPAMEERNQASEVTPETSEVRGGNETIMVVEDEPALRELLIKILRGLGYRVIEASHGREALKIWQRAPEKPRMLLTDMMMPEGMTGWELAEQLRDEQPELKVVYTSGYSPELFGGKVKLHEQANFIPKPFHPRTLAQTVRQCLDRESAVNSSPAGENEEQSVPGAA